MIFFSFAVSFFSHPYYNKSNGVCYYRLQDYTPFRQITRDNYDRKGFLIWQRRD